MTHTLNWTGTWTPRPPLRTARAGLGVATVSGQILAIGGMNKGPSLSTVERYDPNADSWQTMSPMRESRVRPSVVYTKIGRSDYSSHWSSDVVAFHRNCPCRVDRGATRGGRCGVG